MIKPSSETESREVETDVSAIEGLQELWAHTTGDPRICIAVLDGPVDLSHPCFERADVTHLETAARQAARVGPAIEHGTHVASVIFGQHNSRIKGVAPGCRGVIVPVFKDDDHGSVAPCSQVELARAIVRAVEFAEQQYSLGLVINISGGQFDPSGQAHPFLADVVRQCNKSKVLIVAAAGNQGCDCLHIPGAIPSVLAVGAMDRQGEPLGFSNWGDAYQSQGVLAPGSNILGASPEQRTSIKTGTSYATPIVSGVAALLLSLQLQMKRSPSAVGVRHALLRSALGCDYQAVDDCRKLLAGRLAVFNAMECIRSREESLNENLIHGESNMSESIVPQDDAATATLESFNQSQDAPTPLISAAGFTAVEDVEFSSVAPSDCGCGGKKAAPSLQKVYVIGKLGVDYGTRQRREYFAKRINGDPDNDANLYRYLTARPHQSIDYAILNGPQFAHRADVTALTWIVKIDETPIYALAPMGAFAFETHDTLVAFLRSQLPESPMTNDFHATRSNAIYGEGVERMSVPGVIVGETRLFTGEQVPVLAPDHRGLANWTTTALLNAMQAIAPVSDDASRRVREILERMYELTRNLGVSSRDRALNYAATDALQLQGILAAPENNSQFAAMDLDAIDVEKSPICRPDYDCWDVVITFYDPNVLTRARRGIRYTIDVSDVMPNIISGSQRVFSLR